MSALSLSIVLLLQGGTGEPKTVDTPPVTTPQVQDKKHQGELDSDTNTGKKYAEEVKKQFKLSTNQEMIDRVQRVGGELGKVANETHVKVTWGDKRLNPFNYTFQVIQGDDVNAFSLPGGYIFVYEGLLKFVESDDELAGVMAHEVAHASLRHIATLNREQSKLQLITLPLILASILSGGGEASMGLANLSQLVGLAKTSGWSVSAEEAADYAGFQYLLKTKYQPVGILTFMERLHAKDAIFNSVDLGIFRTHPPTAERVRSLMAVFSEYNLPVRRSLAAPRYRSDIEVVNDVYTLKFDGQVIHSMSGPDAKKRADLASRNLDLFLDQVPNLFDVRRDGSRVYGRNRILVDVQPEDLKGLKEPTEVQANVVLTRLKKAVSNVRLKVWIPN